MHELITNTALHNRPDDYYLFPFWFIFYLLGLHFAAKAIMACFNYSRRRGQWRAMDNSKRTNVVVYILEIVITSALLVMILTNGHSLLFDSQPTTTNSQLMTLQLCLVLLTALYTFELIYRPITNFPLATHHVVTIILSALMIKLVVDHSVVVVSLKMDEGGHPIVNSSLKIDERIIILMRTALILSFHAITEQPTFIGK